MADTRAYRKLASQVGRTATKSSKPHPYGGAGFCISDNEADNTLSVHVNRADFQLSTFNKSGLNTLADLASQDLADVAFGNTPSNQSQECQFGRKKTPFHPTCTLFAPSCAFVPESCASLPMGYGKDDNFQVVCPKTI